MRVHTGRTISSEDRATFWWEAGRTCAHTRTLSAIFYCGVVVP